MLSANRAVKYYEKFGLSELEAVGPTTQREQKEIKPFPTSGGFKKKYYKYLKVKIGGLKC